MKRNSITAVENHHRRQGRRRSGGWTRLRKYSDAMMTLTLRGKETVTGRTMKGTKKARTEARPACFYFFAIVKLLILSSRISHTFAVYGHAIPLPNDCFFSAIPRGNDGFLSTIPEGITKGEGEGLLGTGSSRSTTRTTARPSRTLRTFSASHSFLIAIPLALAPTPEPAPAPGADPENASQNALPSFPSNVCDAIAASAACSLVGAGAGLGPGDGGGEGYGFFPPRPCDFEEGGDDAKYAGLRPDANPCGVYPIPCAFALKFPLM